MSQVNDYFERLYTKCPFRGVKKDSNHSIGRRVSSRNVIGLWNNWKLLTGKWWVAAQELRPSLRVTSSLWTHLLVAWKLAVSVHLSYVGTYHFRIASNSLVEITCVVNMAAIAMSFKNQPEVDIKPCWNAMLTIDVILQNNFT